MGTPYTDCAVPASPAEAAARMRDVAGERAVIRGLLREPKACLLHVRQLTRTDFTDPPCEAAFDAVVFAANGPARDGMLVQAWREIARLRCKPRMGLPAGETVAHWLAELWSENPWHTDAVKLGRRFGPWESREGMDEFFCRCGAGVVRRLAAKRAEIYELNAALGDAMNRRGE